jgi:hypothetical protein
MEQHRNADPELPHIVMLVASGPFRFPAPLLPGAPWADVVVSYPVRDRRETEALRYDPRNRKSCLVSPNEWADPGNLRPALPPLGAAPALRSVSVGRLGPVRLPGRLRGSFAFGLAVPRTWARILAHGLEISLPKQSLPRVTWSLGNPSSDGCAPLAASAVRRPDPKILWLVFRHCLRASLPPRSG